MGDAQTSFGEPQAGARYRDCHGSVYEVLEVEHQARATFVHTQLISESNEVPRRLRRPAGYRFADTLSAFNETMEPCKQFRARRPFFFTVIYGNSRRQYSERVYGRKMKRGYLAALRKHYPLVTCKKQYA